MGMYPWQYSHPQTEHGHLSCAAGTRVISLTSVQKQFLQGKKLLPAPSTGRQEPGSTKVAMAVGPCPVSTSKGTLVRDTPDICLSHIILLLQEPVLDPQGGLNRDLLPHPSSPHSSWI